MQKQIEALLANYQLTHLIDPKQVRINLDNQSNDYEMIQAIFNDQIDQATQQRDWQRIIELLKAMVQLSQNFGNFDDTIIAQISLLYLTYSRYYNTDLMQAEINPLLMQLQLSLQQGNTDYATLDGLLQNVVNNLTVPNNLPLALNPKQALQQLISQSANGQSNSDNPQASAQASDEIAQVLLQQHQPVDETYPNTYSDQARVPQNTPDMQNVPMDDDLDEDEDDVETPFYKKWWFWTLIVLILLIIAIIIRLVVTKVTQPSTQSSDARTEQVTKSDTSKKTDSAKKKTSVQLPSLLG